jgi:hypothetical protein
MTLRRISEPFDNGRKAELTWLLPCCGEIAYGGTQTWIIDAAERGLYMVGDQYVMQATQTS